MKRSRSRGCILGPGENPLRPGEVAVRVDINRILNEPGYLIGLMGGEAALPDGLRPGSVVGPRRHPRRGL